MKKVFKQKKGITLIALVITIIVLLILAGISISMLSGDNSILQKVTDAKTLSERASVIEQARTDVLGCQVDNNGGGLSKTQLKSVLDKYFYEVPDLNNMEKDVILNAELNTLAKYGTHKIKVYEIYNENFKGETETPKGPNGKPLINKNTVSSLTTTKITGEDKLGNQIVIPEGFKLAQGTNGSGETAKEGIVIEDSEGNQYVWVPVSNINHDGSNKIKVDSANEEGVEITLGRYTFATDSPGNPTLAANSYQYASSYATSVTIPSYYQELTTYRESNGLSDSTGTNTTAKNLQEFVESVRDNKGYYIARYEASYRANGKAGSKVSTSSAETLALTSEPASRTAGDLWNFVKQGEAANACYDLYTTVNSDLMNSYTWDTAIVYIEAMGNTNYANGTGNTSFLNTGTTGDEKCKIFDMAGNTREWTTEYSSRKVSSIPYPCVYRGGNYSGASTYTRERWEGLATDSYRGRSFRPILYF